MGRPSKINEICPKHNVPRVILSYQRSGKPNDSDCPECRRDKHKLYYKNNRKHLELRYGIDLGTYNIIFDLQKGRCASCGKHQHELKRRLAVDHCHATGLVRGLLCTKCNQGIGYFNDNPMLLTQAANYLKGLR